MHEPNVKSFSEIGRVISLISEVLAGDKDSVSREN